MRLYVGITIGLLLGAGAMLLSMGGTPWVAADCTDTPCADPPCCNGDVNGDGKIDIADAIRLLGYLFGTGDNKLPEPEAIVRLAATGQTECFDNTQELTAGCPPSGLSFCGQDGSYQAGCSAIGRFVDNGDGTVTDTCTGLMWQKETAKPVAGGVFDPDSDGLMTWEQALAYCESLGAVVVDQTFRGAEKTDWRLPNIRELLSLVRYDLQSPAMDPVFGVPSEDPWKLYWSSTTLEYAPEWAWPVCFEVGHVATGVQMAAENKVLGHKTYGYYVRAVRDAR